MRLFFAIWPPKETAATLAAWAGQAQREVGGRVARAETTPLTLAFLGGGPGGRARGPLLPPRRGGGGGAPGGGRGGGGGSRDDPPDARVSGRRPRGARHGRFSRRARDAGRAARTADRAGAAVAAPPYSMGRAQGNTARAGCARSVAARGTRERRVCARAAAFCGACDPHSQSARDRHAASATERRLACARGGAHALNPRAARPELRGDGAHFASSLVR